MRAFSLDTEDTIQKSSPDKTYALRKESVEGTVNGLEAVKQAVEKILNTERYEYPVYSFYYGAELQKLTGKEQPYVRAELKRIITEALLWDDRIKDVSSFNIIFSGDVCKCSFNVQSTLGSFGAETEVTV